MAGTIEAPRVSLQYRNQWPKLNNAYNTVSASFDVLSEKLKSGVGIHLLNDVKGGGLLNLFQADPMLTKNKVKRQIELSGRHTAGSKAKFA